jgi:hypothetical protein
LVTNKSEDDLIYKEKPDAVENHKEVERKPKKIIKKYELNLSEVTGVEGM